MQNGLRVLTTQFCKTVPEIDEFGDDVLDRNREPKRTTPRPRVELPYTYLVAWFIMHCPSLMSAVKEHAEGVPFVQRLERSTWLGNYSAVIRRIIQSSTNYQLFRCFPDFPGATFGDEFIYMVPILTDPPHCPWEYSGG